MFNFYLLVSTAFPLISENEIAVKNDRFVLIPDIQGRLYLEDLATAEIEPFFNARTDVIFYLYTRNNRDYGQRLPLDENAIRKTNFKDRNTRFLIHGWNNDGGSEFNRFAKAALLDASDSNVVIVDWGAGAQTINYLSARNRVNEVGPFVAEFINFLVSKKLVSSHKKINIIGHSLGAHISGIAGKKTSQKVAVVFGLDPAGM